MNLIRSVDSPPTIWCRMRLPQGLQSMGRTLCLALAALTLTCLATPAVATPAADAARCAGLWLGTADFRAAFAIAGPDDGASALGVAFRAAALRLGGDAAAIARDRAAFRLMLEGYVFVEDRQSIRLYQRSAVDCDRIGLALDETRGLLRKEPEAK